MNFYQELVLHNTNCSYKLWSKVYYELHLSLHENKFYNIGVSFPEYHFNNVKQIGFLGGKLRVFAIKKEYLLNIDLQKRLSRFNKDISFSEILPVPNNISSYCIYSRAYFKNNASSKRQAKRRVKFKKDMDLNQAIEYYKNNFELKIIHLPYIIILKSKSTGQEKFSLFIEKKLARKTDNFQFNTYGLSKVSSVPEF